MNPVTLIDEITSRTVLLAYLRTHQDKAFSRVELQSYVKLPKSLFYSQACELLKRLLGRLLTLNDIEQSTRQVGDTTIITYRYKPVKRPIHDRSS